MNIQKYTQKSIEALQSAQTNAQENGNQQIQQIHLYTRSLSSRKGLYLSCLKMRGSTGKDGRSAQSADRPSSKGQR